MGKRRSKVKTLQKKCEKLFREIVLERDGYECQVKKYFPFLRISHDNILQVDHCISRKNKWYFLDPRNGTCVCRTCNMAKSLDIKSVSRAIDEIVVRREGVEWFQQAVAEDQTLAPNINWSKVWWLEEQLERLQDELKRVKRIKRVKDLKK